MTTFLKIIEGFVWVGSFAFAAFYLDIKSELVFLFMFLIVDVYRSVFLRHVEFLKLSEADVDDASTEYQNLGIEKRRLDPTGEFSRLLITILVGVWAWYLSTLHLKSIAATSFIVLLAISSFAVIADYYTLSKSREINKQTLFIAAFRLCIYLSLIAFFWLVDIKAKSSSFGFIIALYIISNFGKIIERLAVKFKEMGTKIVK